MKAKIIFLPFFCIYYGFAIIRDVVPFYQDYALMDWLALIGMFIIGTSISLPLFLTLLKGNASSSGFLKRTLISALIGNFMQVTVLIMLWRSSIGIYVCMSLLPLMVYLLLAFKNGGDKLMMDKDTGLFYTVRGEKIIPLTPAESIRYLTSNAHSPSVIEFSSSLTPMFDGAISFQELYPVNSFGNELHSNQVVNPSSGVPMVGGIGGLDIHGNSFGTNFNEPSSNYDPSRGY